MKRIDGYFIREMVPLFLLALALIVLALLMDQFLGLADVIIARGVGAGTALRLLGLLVPSAAAFALPLAFLTGLVVAVSRLSVDSEVTALRALGIPARRLARSAVFLAAVCSLAAFWLTAYAAPRANAVWTDAMAEAVLGDGRPRIEPLEFSRTIPGTVVFCERIGGGGIWRNVLAYMEGGNGSGPKLILADEGRARVDRASGRIVLDFGDGRVHEGVPSGSGTFSVTGFSRLTETVEAPAASRSLTPVRSVREKDLGELLRARRELAAAGHGSGREAVLAEIEIQKKFSLPFLCFLFAFFGPALGLLAGRKGRSAGFALSLVLILAVYFLYITAERLALAGRFGPAVSMWLPPAVLAAAGAVVLVLAGGRGFRSKLFCRSGGGRCFAEGHAGSGPRPAGFAQAPFAALDRYVFRKTLLVLCLAAPAFLLAASLGLAFEMMGDFARAGNPVSLLARYVAFRTPELFSLVLPVAMLTAAVAAVGFLVRSNELTAMKACGLSIYRAMAPVVVLGLLASALAFMVREDLMPPAEERAQAILDRALGRPERILDLTGLGWYYDAAARRVYHYEYFEPGSSKFGRFSVFEIDPERWELVGWLTADEAVLVPGGKFELRNGFRTGFGPGSADVQAAPVSGNSVALLEARGADKGLFGPAAAPSRMRFGRLRSYVRKARGLGFDTGRLDVELAARVSLALASLIMALIGLPAGMTIGRRGVTAGTGAAIVVAAAYWGLFAFLRSLGYGGILPAAAAAWGADLVFGLAAVALILRLRT